jgi:uncharacterized phosphosugar-binding protein
MLFEEYFEKVREQIECIESTQAKAIENAAMLIMQTTGLRRRTFVFGSGHSGLVAQEASFRTGGLPIFNPIFVPGLLTTDYPYLRSGLMERISGIAEATLKFLPVQKDDTIIIISNSGRNHVPIEMAMECRERGMHTIAITNLTFSMDVQSRHPSGKRLFELVDIVIDNCCPVGDSVVKVPGTPAKLGPMSTISGVLIMHALSCRISDMLLEDGTTPPVFISGNVDGSEAYNCNIFEAYRDLITYL